MKKVVILSLIISLNLIPIPYSKQNEARADAMALPPNSEEVIRNMMILAGGAALGTVGVVAVVVGGIVYYKCPGDSFDEKVANVKEFTEKSRNLLVSLGAVAVTCSTRTFSDRFHFHLKQKGEADNKLGPVVDGETVKPEVHENGEITVGERGEGQIIIRDGRAYVITDQGKEKEVPLGRLPKVVQGGLVEQEDLASAIAKVRAAKYAESDAIRDGLEYIYIGQRRPFFYPGEGGISSKEHSEAVAGSGLYAFIQPSSAIPYPKLLITTPIQDEQIDGKQRTEVTPADPRPYIFIQSPAGNLPNTLPGYSANNDVNSSYFFMNKPLLNEGEQKILGVFLPIVGDLKLAIIGNKSAFNRVQDAIYGLPEGLQDSAGSFFEEARFRAVLRDPYGKLWNRRIPPRYLQTEAGKAWAKEMQKASDLFEKLAPHLGLIKKH